jgi:GDP-L-fucose synthase
MKKVLILGHSGLLGSALVRRCRLEADYTLLTPSRHELDLTDQVSVRRFFEVNRPTEVYLAAARVGGILGNMRFPANFIRDNLLIEANVIDAAFQSSVGKLLFFGSSCIYPRQAPQPLRPEYLLSGPLEESNRAYAMAKLAGIELCRAYRQQHNFRAIVAMPCNLYGVERRSDLENTHVIPALLSRFIDARRAGAPEVVVWGSGLARREFLHVDDMADAAVFLMNNYDGDDPVNVGPGEDVTITELAETIASVVGYSGKIRFDSAAPEGVIRKLLDVTIVRELGWAPKISLRDGLAEVVRMLTT